MFSKTHKTGTALELLQTSKILTTNNKVGRFFILLILIKILPLLCNKNYMNENLRDLFISYWGILRDLFISYWGILCDLFISYLGILRDLFISYWGILRDFFISYLGILRDLFISIFKIQGILT